VLDMAAWLLMTLAFVYCAIKIIKTPNDEWDLPRWHRPYEPHLTENCRQIAILSQSDIRSADSFHRG
jgi:hypothetical protein